MILNLLRSDTEVAYIRCYICSVAVDACVHVHHSTIFITPIVCLEIVRTKFLHHIETSQ